MNEEKVKQLRELEKKAQDLYEAAVQEAQRLPQQAEAEARDLLETSRSAAQAEAKRILSAAQDNSQTEKIMQQAEEEAERKESLAMNHFDRALNYVLHRIAGRQ